MKYLFLMLSSIILSQNLPQVSSGKLVRLENFNSEFVTSRNVDIWLPENYDGKKKFAVLYMQDGQMLYDASSTWNKQAWEADDTAAELMLNGETQNFIIVGVWNGGETRHSDYFPQKPFESLSEDENAIVQQQLKDAGKSDTDFQPTSDAYLRFLVEELKPYIDKNYAVKKGRKHTYIAGSSMGGLISMYALIEYPNVFNGAACLSTHWPGTFSAENNPVPNAFMDYLDQNLHRIKRRKIYFDYGNQTLDAMYPPLQKQVDALMKKHGFTSKNWKTGFFDGANHSEDAWKARLDIPFRFLLGK